MKVLVEPKRDPETLIKGMWLHKVQHNPYQRVQQNETIRHKKECIGWLHKRKSEERGCTTESPGDSNGVVYEVEPPPGKCLFRFEDKGFRRPCRVPAETERPRLHVIVRVTKSSIDVFIELIRISARTLPSGDTSLGQSDPMTPRIQHPAHFSSL